MDFERVVAWRHHIHKYPELSGQEFETSQYVYEVLSAIPGIRLSRPTDTSVVAEIGSGKPVVLFRAELDALECTENLQKDFASVNEGVAHVCGHDAHTAMLMGVAEELAAHADQLKGTARLVFQHSEEKVPHGAEELVKKGICSDVKCAFALHVEPNHPTGSIIITDKYTTTASTRFEMTITGKGGHTSTPDACVDPILVGAQIVAAAQSIISRNVSPKETAVLSFGAFHSGTVSSAIPETAYLNGSMRSFRREVTDEMQRRFEKIVYNICDMNGATVDLKCTYGLPTAYNDPGAVRIVEEAAKKACGEDMVLTGADAIPGGDDFAFYAQRAKACFFRLGAGEAKDGYGYMNHSANFDIDEKCFVNGVNTMVQITYDLLK